MMSKEILLVYLLFSLLLACASQKKIGNEIIGEEYIAQTENRKLKIKIIDADNLVITNIFNCTNIDEKFKIVSFKKQYFIHENAIVLKDSLFKFNIPYFNNSNCEFLSEHYRTQENKRIFDGRLIITNREELYTIWNIDTLKIVGKKLIYFKKNSKGSKGYLFEKV